jgi:hypothetical protein
MKTDTLRDQGTPEGERRCASRRPCAEEIPLWPLGSGHVEEHRACVRDISRVGVGLFIHYPFEPGSVLAMNLRCHRSGPSRMAVGRVVRLTRGPQHNWLLGCAFERPLAPEVFEALQHEGNGDEDDVTVQLT